MPLQRPNTNLDLGLSYLSMLAAGDHLMLSERCTIWEWREKHLPQNNNKKPNYDQKVSELQTIN